MRVTFVLAGLICTFDLASSASAVERNLPTRPPAAIGKAVQLTEAECKGFGGRVVPNYDCASGNSCWTTDKNGVIHRGCINAK
jgi:hypothetical protein